MAQKLTIKLSAGNNYRNLLTIKTQTLKKTYRPYAHQINNYVNVFLSNLIISQKQWQNTLSNYLKAY